MSKRMRPARLGVLAASPLLLALGAPGLYADPPPTAPTYLEAADGKARRPRPTLTGVVVDAQGRPAAGATILLYTAAPRVGTSPFCPSCYPDCQKKEVTDGKGAFKVASLDPALLFTVLVVADGRPPQFVRGVDPAKGPVRVQLPPAPPPSDPRKTVRGRVLDADGKPVSGAVIETVSLQRGNTGMYGSIPGVAPVTITGRQGDFQFALPDAGSVLGVLVKTRDHAPRVAADLTPGRPEPHPVRLTRGAAVSGRLTDAKGKGIGGATVQLVPVDREAGGFTGWHDIGTGADGAFTLVNIPADKEYVLLAKMDGIAAAGFVVRQQRIKTGGDGTSVTGADLKAEPGASLSGRVVLSDGKPVPAGVRLMIGREGTWDEQFALLGAGGRFSFSGLPCEEKMGLTVRVPGYKMSAKNAKVRPWGTLEMTIASPDTAPRGLTILLEPEPKKNP